jgi:hypothetical protein
MVGHSSLQTTQRYIEAVSVVRVFGTNGGLN